jgi:hypothetical protein
MRWIYSPVESSTACLSKDFVVLGGLVVIVLDTGIKVRGFRPGRGRWVSKGDRPNSL